MPIFSPYFPLESNAYRVGNSGKLRRKMGCAGFGLYVMVLSHLRDCPDFTTALDYEALAFEFQESETSLRHVVEDFDLFLIDREAGTFTASVLQDMSDLVSRRRPWRRSDEERPRRVSKRTARCADDEGADEASETGSATETDADDNATAESTHGETDETATPETLAEHESASPQNAADAAERKEKNKRPSPPIVPLPRGSGRGATPTREEAEAEANLSLRQSEMPAAEKHALGAAQEKHIPDSKNDSSAAEEGNNAAKTSAMSPAEHPMSGEEGEHSAKNGNAAMENASSATETSARNGEEGEHFEKNENAMAETPEKPAEKRNSDERQCRTAQEKHSSATAKQPSTSGECSAATADSASVSPQCCITAETSARSEAAHTWNGKEGDHFEKNESATTENNFSADETSAGSEAAHAWNGKEGEHFEKNENAAMENASSATETSARSEAAHTTSDKSGPTADETRTATDGACPSAHGGGTAASSATTPPAPTNCTTGKNRRTPRHRPWRYRAQSPFVAPNAEEVTEYALSTGHRGFDARRFVLYYQARGWVLQGGVAVADWRSLVQLWLARGENRGKSSCDTAAPQPIGAQAGNASPYGGGASQRPSTFGADSPGGASTRGTVNRPTDTAVQRERTADFAMMVRDLMGETADTWLADPVAAPHCAELPPALAATTTPPPADTPCARSATTTEETTTPALAPTTTPTPADTPCALSPTTAEEATTSALTVTTAPTPADTPLVIPAATAEEATLPRETTDERQGDSAPAKDEIRHFEPLKNELRTSLQTYDYDDESLLPQAPKHSPIDSSTADERAGAHRLVSLADGNNSSAATAARRNRAAELRECVLALSAYDAGRVDF